MNLLEEKYEKVFQNKKHSLYKSTDGIVISYSDGTKEGFVRKASLNINEGKLGRAIELILVLGLGLAYFNTDITIVDGISMEPTYKNFEIIIKTKAETDVQKILVSRNSMVRFKSPDGNTCFKRVVATPGDEITLEANFVYVNGKVVDTKNMDWRAKARKSDGSVDPNWITKKLSFRLKDNQYYVMGDNRMASIDSRHYGPIDSDAILSVVKK